MEDTNSDLDLIARSIDPEEMEKINDYYNTRSKMILMRYGEKGYVLPENSSNFLAKIKRTKIRPSDTFVASFSKSGTTWTQELVWLIQNDLNFEKAASVRLTNRFSFLEIPMFFTEIMGDLILKHENISRGIEILFPRKMSNIEEIPSPRFFKTHLPMSLLPCKVLENCKVVYIARDPRDVAVSLYYHTLLMKSCAENKTVKDIWSLLIKDQVPGSPYFEHVKEAWNLREHPNLLFLFYEELSKEARKFTTRGKRSPPPKDFRKAKGITTALTAFKKGIGSLFDLPAVVRRVASFFGKQLTQDEILKLCEHLEFKNFKRNPSVNLAEAKKCGFLDEHEHFIRKGVVGDWVMHFDDEMKEQAERWMSENMRDTNLCFPH